MIKTTKTGRHLTLDELDQVRATMTPVIEIDLATQITTTTQPGPDGARRLVKQLARQHGLPDLPAGQCYGLEGTQFIKIG